VLDELTAKDATVSSIAHHFETLVAELTDKTHRDPRTRLINFDHFTSQLESFLALEKRGRCCAVGLVDITGFKWYNDTLGHAAGDRIIERVATLLREQARSDDLLARDLHARLGGDEFCFMIPDLTECSQAQTIGERFRAAVEHYDWTSEDARLSAQPVRVDVGVACVWLGGLAERRDIAKALSADLLQRADKLMYGAKAERAGRIFIAELTIENGALVEI
jgi:diguanylate cyclase (GGDEF)-like protein